MDISLANVRHSYPGGSMLALDIGVLNVRAGEKIALIGASGAGKTTLLKLIDGRLSGWSGSAEVAGRSLAPSHRLPRHARSAVGFVFQDFALIDRLTVFQNVRNGRLGRAHPLLSLAGSFSKSDLDAVDRAIAEVDLKDLAHRRVDRLSGGQRQRAAIARCLAQDPDIILADEPVSSLDPGGAERTLELLRATAEARGATLVIGSHQPSMVARVVDRVVGLKLGQIVLDRQSACLRQDDLASLYGLKLAVRDAA